MSANVDADNPVIAARILFRHGARYPNKAELAAFGEDNEIRTQWHDGDKRLYDDDNNLSDVGRRQMETLGRFFGGEYAQLLGNDSVRWESSPAERCEESGKLFLKGFEAASSCQVPSKPIEDNQRMVTFKAWAQTGTPYFASVQGLKSGDHEAHAMRARSRRRSLENMYAELNEDHTEVPDSLLLYWSCYLHCLAEAEAYDCEPLPEPSICPATKGRNNLRFNLDWAQLWECERDARATWAARFLNVGEHRGFVGGHLKRKLFDSGGGPLKVFSGHDYSILSLLAAFGLSDYPEPALGFGAYVVVELRRDGSLDVRLNPAPFRDAKNRVCTSVDASRVRPVVVEDVDLAEPPSDDAALRALGASA